MRFRFATVEDLLRDTLQILIFAVIVGCPFNGYRWEIEAMTARITTTMTAAPASALSQSTATVTITTTAPSKELFPVTSTAATSTHYPSTPDTLSTAQAFSDVSYSHSPAARNNSNTGELLLPRSDTQHDSNEIDSAEDYVMTEHIASHATTPHSNGTRTRSRTQDLSSLSLLSLNDTTANSPQPRSSHGGKNANSTATFQHIGSQLIALKSTTATATGNNSSSSGGGGGASGSNKSNVVRISAKKVDSKYVLPKPQKTDAPMLNYIFDTFSSANKHHHHDQRYGPHFEDMDMLRLGQPTNLTVQAGSSIHLNCRISLLQDKTVSWVRRNGREGENALDLLTVGLHTYTGDKRYKMEFQYPNNWRLKITNVKKDDEAMYECQISTHPPRVIQINLHVNAPKVMIVDEIGDPLQEKYYEIDSTLQLSCVVRNVAMTSSVVYWKHAEDVLNYDVTRGGVSVKTELMDDGANSTLFIAKINKADSGNYTCAISDFQNFTIVVHILNGESFAELHHGGAVAAHFLTFQHTLPINLVTLLILRFCWPAVYINR